MLRGKIVNVERKKIANILELKQKSKLVYTIKKFWWALLRNYYFNIK
jgi:DNA gyrase/topoisomerase IV subunit B